MWLEVINKAKVTIQGRRSHQGQSKISTSLQILCSPYSLQAGCLHSTEMLLVCLVCCRKQIRCQYKRQVYSFFNLFFSERLTCFPFVVMFVVLARSWLPPLLGGEISLDITQSIVSLGVSLSNSTTTNDSNLIMYKDKAIPR